MFKEIKKKFREISEIKKGIEELNDNLTCLKTSMSDLKKLEKKSNEIICQQEGIKKGIKQAYTRVIDETARLSIPYRRYSDNSIRGRKALETLISDFDFNTVLDIGCGEGIHTEAFLNAGKTVTAVDYGKSDYFLKKGDSLDAIVADFNIYDFGRTFDCVWCSHVLEHQLNVNIFLKKIYTLLDEDGILAISVPPAKQEIVGGHVSLWNCGILLYNLILAGFDCSDAWVNQYDYDISVIVRKKSVPSEVYDAIAFDVGDISSLKEYFPKGIEWKEKERDVSFDGESLKLLNLSDGKEIDKIIENEKKKGEKYTLKRWVEITTKIGCSNNCSYCPQSTLLSAYRADRSRKLDMSLDDFKMILKHVPKWLDICFTGMNEPFENKKAFDMVEYALKKGYKVHIYSTLKGLTRVQIERFKELNVKTYVMHLPDKDGMMKLNPDEEYIKKLTEFDALNLKNVKYVCIGELHTAIPKHIAKKVKCNKVVISRAGNVNNEKLDDSLNYHAEYGRLFDKDTKVICSRRLQYRGEDRTATHIETTIVLPDGSLVLCCNDWGLQHVLGNLYEQDYESIMYGPVMQDIEKSMMCESDTDILCRKCEFACVYDDKKWKTFCDKGIY